MSCGRCCLNLLCWCFCCQGCHRKEQAKEPLLDKKGEPQKATEVQEMEYKFVAQSEPSSEAGTDWESEASSEAGSLVHPDEVELRDSDLLPANATPTPGSRQSTSSGETMVRSASGRASWKLVPSPIHSPIGKSRGNKHS